MNNTAPIILLAREPEVPEVVKRRKYTVAYKLRILKETDACADQGQIGALLRRERLYHSAESITGLAALAVEAGSCNRSVIGSGAERPELTGGGLLSRSLERS